MEQSAQDLTLGQLLTRAINHSNRISSAPSPNDQSIQQLLQATLADLNLANKLINHLGILSPNETLEDINTNDLRCLLTDALSGQLCLLAKTKGGKERVKYLNRAADHFRKYNSLVEQYEIVPQDQRSAYQGVSASEMDSARRRAGKIAQFKREKEIKSTLEELRKRRRERSNRRTNISVASPSASTSTSPAPAPQPTPEDDEDFLSEDDDESDDVARPLLISLLQLHYLRAHAELSSLEQELELLEHGMKMSEIPSPSPHLNSSKSKEESRAGEEDSEDLTWRLDKVSLTKDDPLLSPSGKVLRPFTILPSSKSASQLQTRLRLQSEVFQSSHRLPTMTIDEYLDQQNDMGNILQGGGPSTSEEVEQARKDEQGEKEDDTQRGYEAEERELRKTREFDEYRDTHRKGEGNIMTDLEGSYQNGTDESRDIQEIPKAPPPRLYSKTPHRGGWRELFRSTESNRILDDRANYLESVQQWKSGEPQRRLSPEPPRPDALPEFDASAALQRLKNVKPKGVRHPIVLKAETRSRWVSKHYERKRAHSTPLRSEARAEQKLNFSTDSGLARSTS
ncbi:hypothetical protein JCM3765_002803 [Sporobolomyces pararoseus]